MASSRKAAVKKNKNVPVTEKVFFITGFSGFIGKRMVEKLVSVNPKAFFHLLVREKSKSAAQDTVEYIEKKYPYFTDNSKIHIGSLSQPSLGFANNDLDALCKDVTEVWHMGAVYDFKANEPTTYKANVEGTKRVVDICVKAPKLEKLVHFSSIYVSGTRCGLVLEDELDFGQSFNNHYEATKFEAEKIVREKAKELPAIIIRPAIVVGDSSTGETDKFDGPYYLFKFLSSFEKVSGIFPFPYFGNGEGALPIIPIDYLVESVDAIAASPSSLGKCFHICDPTPITLRRFQEITYEKFGFRKFSATIPHTLLNITLKIGRVSDTLGVPRQVLDYGRQYTVFDCANTTKALEGFGIKCPSFEDYFDNLVGYFNDNR